MNAEDFDFASVPPEAMRSASAAASSSATDTNRATPVAFE